MDAEKSPAAGAAPPADPDVVDDEEKTAASPEKTAASPLNDDDDGGAEATHPRVAEMLLARKRADAERDNAAAAKITAPEPAGKASADETQKFAEVQKLEEGTPESESPDTIMAVLVVEEPDKYLSAFLDYWGEHLPDLSEGRPPKLQELQFWKSGCAALKAHTTLPGLCAKWLHIAIDFAIAHNQWPVRFMKGDDEYDMVTPFIITVWVCYAAQMNGCPDLSSKACTKVNPSLQNTNPSLQNINPCFLNINPS